MKIDVLTIYPGMFPGPLDESIVKRARESGMLQLGVRDLRDYTHDRHRCPTGPKTELAKLKENFAPVRRAEWQHTASSSSRSPQA